MDTHGVVADVGGGGMDVGRRSERKPGRELRAAHRDRHDARLPGRSVMARVLPVAPHVLWGMATFGLGHVAYIAAIIGFGNAHGLHATAPRWGAVADRG